MFNGKAGGGFGVDQRRSGHGTAAIKHRAEGRGTRSRLVQRVGDNAEREADGLGAVGEDGLVVEESFNLHTHHCKPPGMTSVVAPICFRWKLPAFDNRR